MNKSASRIFLKDGDNNTKENVQLFGNSRENLNDNNYKLPIPMKIKEMNFQQPCKDLSFEDDYSETLKKMARILQYNDHSPFIWIALKASSEIEFGNNKNYVQFAGEIPLWFSLSRNLKNVTFSLYDYLRKEYICKSRNIKIIQSGISDPKNKHFHAVVDNKVAFWIEKFTPELIQSFSDQELKSIIRSYGYQVSKFISSRKDLIICVDNIKFGGNDREFIQNLLKVSVENLIPSASGLVIKYRKKKNDDDDNETKLEELQIGYIRESSTQRKTYNWYDINDFFDLEKRNEMKNKGLKTLIPAVPSKCFDFDGFNKLSNTDQTSIENKLKNYHSLLLQQEEINSKVIPLHSKDINANSAAKRASTHLISENKNLFWESKRLCSSESPHYVEINIPIAYKWEELQLFTTDHQDYSPSIVQIIAIRKPYNYKCYDGYCRQREQFVTMPRVNLTKESKWVTLVQASDVEKMGLQKTDKLTIIIVENLGKYENNCRITQIRLFGSKAIPSCSYLSVKRKYDSDEENGQNNYEDEEDEESCLTCSDC